MSLKLFLPLFVSLYNFGQSTFDLLFRRSLKEVFEAWIALDLGLLDDVLDSAFNALISIFPDLMQQTPILFLLTSGLAIIIIFNCAKFIISIIP